MVRLQLDERQWLRIKAALGVRKRAGRPGRDDRNFVEAVLWWRRTGAPWRDLPSDFGPWKTVFNRFDLRNYAAVVALGCALLWLRV